MLAALAVLTLTVPLAGGSLLHMRDPGFRRSWLLFSALGVQLLITVVLTGVLSVEAGKVLHVVSYVMAFGWVGSNRHVTGLWVAAIGGAMNMAAIVANGGQMPASEAALAGAGMGEYVEHFVNSGVVEGGARLQVLGDIFYVPASWPLANVFSIGDVVLVIGGGLLVHHFAGSPWLVGEADGGAVSRHVASTVRRWTPTAAVVVGAALLVRTPDGLVVAGVTLVVLLVVDPRGPSGRQWDVAPGDVAPAEQHHSPHRGAGQRAGATSGGEVARGMSPLG